MLPDEVAELRRLVLGLYKEAFCRGLTGESPAQVELGSVQVRSMAVYACPDADYSLPSKSSINDKQLELVELVEGRTYVCIVFGPATPDAEGLFRVALKGAVHPVVWIPVEANNLHVRLMVCAHMGNGHRGTATTLQVLRNYCVWQGMKKDVANFVKRCLYCQDSKVGKMVPLPMEEVVNGESVGEVVYFDFLHIGVGRPLGTKGARKQGHQYLMVIVDNLSSFVWMEEAATCTAEVAARGLLRWCSVIGVPRVWVTDTAKHFKNHALGLVVEHLGADHRFSVSNTAWTNGTVERMMLRIITMFRVVASATRIPLMDWVRIVPVVQAALYAGYRERLKASPFNLMFDREQCSTFSALVAPRKDEW